MSAKIMSNIVTKTGRSHVLITGGLCIGIVLRKRKVRKQNGGRQRNRNENFRSILGLVKLSGLSLLQKK